ncbi:F-box protein [Phanerochaete sordida]|uniref:F-box protein n=1 Tax=Phanerochaete sordida TaxID=48140 RepID=A0A9P3GKH2_9APHY|nr:F-box protein [Phanerochaete sordida]
MILDISRRHGLNSVARSFLEDTHLGYELDCVAIGHFDATGEYEPCYHHGRTLHPTGDDAVVRRVSADSNDGEFQSVVDFEYGARVERDAPSTCYTDHGGWPCNIWVHVACWAYLQEWLACPLLPRTGRAGTPLSLAGELYEVAASRYEPPAPRCGALPCIDYGGTLGAYMGTEGQNYILGSRRGVKHIVKALEDGLRGMQLAPAIRKDSRYWMWIRPDIWPRALHQGPQQPTQLYISSSTMAQTRAALCSLPNELFPELLQHCQLEDLFALASTCKELHARVLDRGSLAHTLQLSMADRSSPLRWTLPVPSLREEWLVACEAMQTWLPAGSTTPPTSANVTSPATLPPLPLFDPAFPLAAFLRAYRDSDSMRSRRRRWELIKQWDVLFANYRRDGWERDDFVPPGTTWALDRDGILVCQCVPTEAS